MRITELLRKDSIILNAAPKDKMDAINLLVDLQVKSGAVSDKEIFKQEILKRESQGSTAIGEGVAIPHAKTHVVKRPSLAVLTVPDGVDYEALDDEPSHLFFMIAAPNDANLHLEVLAKLMTILMDEDFREQLINSKTNEEFLKKIDEMEKQKDLENEEASMPSDNKIQILAVTACPTGIAHTYMAAEALEKTGKKLGVTIKVETNGSGGAQNILTAEEIANCTGIIVAADKTVNMARFDGKRVLSTKVSDGIKIPETLIKKIQAGDAPIYQHSGEKAAEDSAQGETLGRQAYKHLMNGISNMLPFTVAGGIFIALAFLIDSLLGAPQDGNFGSYTALAAFFKSTGGYAFSFMIPILGAFIGKSIADRPGFLVGLVGGYMATTGSTFANLAGDVPSGFLGALFAGFVGGFMMLQIKNISNKLPKAFNGIKPVLIYPLTGLLCISIIMCAVNPFMGMINTGLSNFLAQMGGTSKILLGLVLAAMMSIDMGGPFNKAAYSFGIAAIASGNYAVMAAVMIGGMVPPIAIALSTSFSKEIWNEDEIKNGSVNYIMGLSFITEGAIPYAAADPLRVIPACMIGAGIAGALSMAFNCALMAPHGGIFVFAVVENWPMYLVSLVV
ncbi:MAG: PTS fructose transporter subunit IIABC, partial [Anaerotignaceae bacterium]